MKYRINSTVIISLISSELTLKYNSPFIYLINKITPRMFFTLLLVSLVKAECELPNMSVGTFNLTTEKQLKDIMKKETAFLIGLSASWCEECCLREPIYKKLLEKLENYRPRIPLVRVDVSTSTFIKKYLPGQDSVPQIVGVHKGTFFKYLDLQTPESLLRFAGKLYSPVQYMHNLTEVHSFLQAPTGKFDTLRILGMLYDSDLQKDFEDAMSAICNWFTAEVRGLMSKSLISQLREERADIPYYNALIMLVGSEIKILDLEVHQNILLWVTRNSVPLLGELTPYNFQMYELNALPMLIMFLDPKDLKNSEYLEIFTKVARRFENDVKFVWVDGTSADYVLKRRKLGLVGNSLPGIAFNLGIEEIYPFAEDKRITEDNLEPFIQGFLDGEKYSDQGKKAKKDKEMPNCTPVTMAEFAENVLKNGHDAVFLVYSSVDSKKIAQVFDKVCKRVKELEYTYLHVYIVDIATQAVHKSVRIDKVPGIYLAPAYNKSPPYVHYTGKIDVLQILMFIEKYAGIQFTLPELPHLSPDEVEEYWKNKEYI